MAYLLLPILSHQNQDMLPPHLKLPPPSIIWNILGYFLHSCNIYRLPVIWQSHSYWNPTMHPSFFSSIILIPPPQMFLLPDLINISCYSPWHLTISGGPPQVADPIHLFYCSQDNDMPLGHSIDRILREIPMLSGVSTWPVTNSSISVAKPMKPPLDLGHYILSLLSHS